LVTAIFVGKRGKERRLVIIDDTPLHRIKKREKKKLWIIGLPKRKNKREKKELKKRR